MADARTNVDYLYPFAAKTGGGAPVLGLVTANFTINVRNPARTLVMAAPTVVEDGDGEYHFVIASAFTNTNGPGVYSVQVVKTLAPTDLLNDKVHFTVDDADTLAADIAALNDLDIADVQAALTAQGYTAARAPNLDNLDATVSSRESEASAAARAATNQIEHDQTQVDVAAVQSSVDAIQNVTRVAISLPKIVIPDAGTIDYKLTLNLFDTAGNPEDPDGPDIIDVTAENQTGASRTANLGGAPVGRMTKLSVGRYEIDYTATAGDAIEQLIFRFTYVENAISFTQDRSTNAVSFIEDHFTAADRANLGLILADTAAIEPLVSLNVDATISSRESAVAAAAREVAVLAAIAALNNISIADVQTALTAQGYTSVRAAFLDFLDVAVSSRESTAAAAVRETNILVAIAALNNLSIADVQTALTAQGYTVARAGNLDNLDAAISVVLTAISALNDLSSGDVDAAITANSVIVLLRKVTTNRRQTNPSTGRLDIFNDADTAVEFSVPIFEDVAGTQPYQGAGIDRQNKIV